MFLREGSQRRAIFLAALGGALLGLTGLAGGSEAAGGLTEGVASGVQLPREVLPWRRPVEERAQRAWAAALEALRRGDENRGTRQLRELIRTYPGTNAALDGRRQLARLEGRRQTRTGRRGLGMRPRTGIHVEHNLPAVSPVAGWETVVRPDSSNVREALIEAAGDRVFFEEGSARLSQRARAVLKKQARWLALQPQVQVRIVGHADDQGSSEHNMRLSHDRAVAVRKGLMGFGVSPKRLHVFSHGRAQPIAICTVTTCAAQNRRVVTEVKLAPATAALR